MERHGKPPATRKITGSPLIAGFDEIFTHERISKREEEKKNRRRRFFFFFLPSPLIRAHKSIEKGKLRIVSRYVGVVTPASAGGDAPGRHKLRWAPIHRRH
jgi:hypothetical protein